MPEEKGLGSKLLGLFVEVKGETPAEGTAAVEGNEEGGEKSAADIVAELAGATAPKKAAPAAGVVAAPVAARPAMPVSMPPAGSGAPSRSGRLRLGQRRNNG
jgi:hypothetical protein